MGKPAFDPNKPFEAVSAAKKPAFDPNKSFQAVDDEVGVLGAVGNALVKTGRVIDSFTGAPVRSAVGAMQEGKNPLSAFIQQVGENPDSAPSAKAIMLNAGVSDKPFAKFSAQQVIDTAKFIPGLSSIAQISDVAIPKNVKSTEFQPSPADVAGFAGDVALDWTNIAPPIATARLATRGLTTAGKVAAKGALTGAEAISKATLPARLTHNIEATKNALSSVFKQAPDFKEYVEIASKNGIDPSLLPESIEFGPNAVLSRGARALREGPLGQPDVERFEKVFQDIQKAAENKIDKIAGGVPPSQVEAGTIIRKGYDDAVERLFKDVDFTYNQVINQAPGISLTPKSLEKVNSKLNALEKFSQKELVSGITATERGQAEQLKRAVDAVRASLSRTDQTSGSFGSLAQVYDVMSRIGKHAFKKGQNALSDIPIDQKKFQELYFTLRNEFVESTAEQLGPDIAQSLIDSNQLITNFNESKTVLAKLIGNSEIAPERLFQSLIVNGDTRKIAALKEILSPEQFSSLKGTLLESLTKRNPDGSIAFGNLFSAMQNRKSTLAEIFEPDEIAEFAEVVKLGNRVGPVVLSTSGTGGSNAFRSILESIESSVFNRTTLDTLKGVARGRSVQPPLRASENIVSPPKYKQLNRTGTDNTLKYLQILGAPSVSGEQESAAQRRLKENARKRLGQ